MVRSGSTASFWRVFRTAAGATRRALKRNLASVLKGVQRPWTWKVGRDPVFVVSDILFIPFADNCIQAGGSDVDRGLNRARGDADGDRSHGYRSHDNADASGSA